MLLIAALIIIVLQLVAFVAAGIWVVRTVRCASKAGRQILTNSANAVGEIRELRAVVEQIIDAAADTEAPRDRRVITTDTDGQSHEGWLVHEDRHRLVLEDALEYHADGSTQPVGGRLHLPAGPNRRTQDVTEVRGASREGTA